MPKAAAGADYGLRGCGPGVAVPSVAEVDHRSGAEPAESAQFVPRPRGEPRALRAALGGNLVARVTWEGQRRTLVVQGLHSERTVRALSRGVASWELFGRYDRVILDLTRMRHPSSDLTTVLSADARGAHARGRRLSFVPPSDASGQAVARSGDTTAGFRDSSAAVPPLA